MAVYLVGPDNRTFTSRRTTWDFEQAVEAANSGDTIEIEEGFNPIDHMSTNILKVVKDLTIKGHLNDQGEVTSFICQLFVIKGANVTIENIGVRSVNEKSNTINVKGKSSLTLLGCIVEEVVAVGESYPLVHVSEESKLSIYDSLISPNQINDGKNNITIQDASFEVIDSQVNTRIGIASSKLKVENSQINNNLHNALFANKSTVEMNSVILNGGKKSEETSYPCVKLLNSKALFNEVEIIQPNFFSALDLVGSSVKASQCILNSLSLTNSHLETCETDIIESVAVFKQSSLKAESLVVQGNRNGRVPLFAGTGSTVNIKELYFAVLKNINVKLDHTVTFNCEEIKLLDYDEGKREFNLNEDGSLIVLDKEIDIEYFGPLPATKRLENMIGIKNVKDEVKEFIAIAQMNKKRKEQGMKTSVLSLHSLFLGNPGTGKTTVARIIGELLFEMKVISKDLFVEVSRTNLVAEYIGQTAPKTRAVLESALGGVLFIDEAYTLAEGGDTDFGKESINEILTFMENHRDDIVIIFAGYTNDMEEFLRLNDGLRSRIPNSFVFPDYTMDELVEIGLLDLYAQEYKIDEKLYAELVHNNFAITNDNSNGRWVRNLNERIIRKLALRIVSDSNANMTEITSDDINGVML